MSKLAVDGVSLRFDNTPVLKEISFKVEEGCFITLLGPSGCGKTTLLRAIAGFIPLDAGSIHIGGKNMAGVTPERRNTAMCFQSYALFPHLTVAENIAFGLKQKRFPQKEITYRVMETALSVSLAGHLDKLPSQLSGGQQQRVALARSMAVRPDVMLFDEPLSNLDARLREQLRLQIRTLQRKQGFTAVYVTHDQAEALAMSDVVIVMDAGTIVQMGTPQNIYYQPVNRFVADFVGTANIMIGNVIASDEVGGCYRITTVLGEMIVTSDEPPLFTRVYVCWRPEDAALLPERTIGQNIFPLKIKRQIFLGNLTDIEGCSDNNDNATFRVQQLGYKPLTEGTIYSFSVASDKLHFLKERVA